MGRYRSGQKPNSSFPINSWANGASEDSMNAAENTQMCVDAEIDSAMGRVLRIMLANNQPTIQHELRQKALVAAENENR